MFPTVACVDVPRPTNPTVAPDSVIGNVVEIVACLLFSVVCKSVPLSESVPKYPLVDDAVMNEPYVVDE